jgi:tetratricopeptide (TPR) repeat protein
MSRYLTQSVSVQSLVGSVVVAMVLVVAVPPRCHGWTMENYIDSFVDHRSWQPQHRQRQHQRSNNYNHRCYGNRKWLPPLMSQHRLSPVHVLPSSPELNVLTKDDDMQQQLRPCATTLSRRTIITSVIAAANTGFVIVNGSRMASANNNDDMVVIETVPDGAPLQQQLQPVLVTVTGDVKKLFNEGRALELQGNVAAAQRLYDKVTQIAPRFIYGWSNLGNTQTSFGDLPNAERSYNTAIDLCQESIEQQQRNDAVDVFGSPRCSDLYILLLNRGSLRLNNNMKQEALSDLRQSQTLRGRPDAIILQNLARAYEMNGLYAQADTDYTTAISMTANEVNPYWIRSAIVKFQLGDVKGGYDLLKRVNNRFPDAPEVRATYAVFLLETGDVTGAQQKFLEIPDRQRLKYSNREYVTQTINWPPAMIERLNRITKAVGDDKRAV